MAKDLVTSALAHTGGLLSGARLWKMSKGLSMVARFVETCVEAVAALVFTLKI